MFLTKFGSLINSLREKNSHENYTVKKYTQRNGTTESKTCRTPYRSNAASLALRIYFSILVVNKYMGHFQNIWAERVKTCLHHLKKKFSLFHYFYHLISWRHVFRTQNFFHKHLSWKIKFLFDIICLICLHKTVKTNTILKGNFCGNSTSL